MTERGTGKNAVGFGTARPMPRCVVAKSVVHRESRAGGVDGVRIMGHAPH